MRDSELLFAVELARSVNRLDWWNVKGEHTPYQWACQWVLYHVAPFGDKRADMRAARNTASLRCALATEQVSESDVRDVVESLEKYLTIHRDRDDIEYDAAALAMIQGG